MEPMIEPVSQPSIIFSPSARERKNKDVETLGNHCTFPHPHSSSLADALAHFRPRT